MKNCNYEYDSNMLMTNVSKMADHMKYHAELKKQGSFYFDGSTHSFPCTECQIEPFSNYGECRDHMLQTHAPIIFKCRIPTCEYSFGS